MLSVRAFIGVIAAVIAVALAQDSCTYSTELECLTADKTGEGCSWCRAAAVPSSCVPTIDAGKLPSGVFICEDSERTGCDAATTNSTCHAQVGCSWCTSRTVSPICANFLNATSLPSSVFTCYGPY